MKNQKITKASGNWWKLFKEIIDDTKNPTFVIPPYQRKFERNQLLALGDYSKVPSIKRNIDFAQSLPKKFGDKDFNRGMSIMTLLEPKERINANLDNLEQYFIDKGAYGNKKKPYGQRMKRSDVLDSPNPGRYAFISPDEINIVRETLENYNLRPDYKQTIRWQTRGENLQNKVNRGIYAANDYNNKKGRIQDLGAVAGTIGAVSALSQSGYPNSEFLSYKKKPSGVLRVNKNLKKKYSSNKYFKG